MVTKTITITEEAYKALLKSKRSYESFSELSLRLAKRRGKIMDCFGLWKMLPEEEDVFRELNSAWHSFDKRFRKEI